MTGLSMKKQQFCARARAPGKVILSGEQFVVLGAPAIAMAINLYSEAEARSREENEVDISIDVPLRYLAQSGRSDGIGDPNEFLKPLRIAAKATLKYTGKPSGGLDLNVNCQIPIAAGLGSSASTTVAIISAVSLSHKVRLDREEIFKLAFIPERFLHGKPSGVDQATCIHGGTIQFSRPSNIEQVKVRTDPVLLLCDTGVHHQTKALVGSVVRRSRAEKASFLEFVQQVREISAGVRKALETGDEHDLGELMSLNHELLQKIGVSHPKLDHLVAVAKREGALGAKLTGAGGGGCIVAICPSGVARKRIARSLMKAGGTPYFVARDLGGVESRSDP